MDCKYCMGDVEQRANLLIPTSGIEGYEQNDIYIDEENYICDMYGEYGNTKINYCPMCGRKLGD